MNRANAEAAIRSVFGTYGIARSAIPTGASSHVRGKVYELYVLTLVIRYLRGLGYRISFSAPRGAVQFKSSPGLLKASDPHFVVARPGAYPSFDIYVDVEFQTLGSARMRSGATRDLSEHHEIDIGVFTYGLNNVRPAHTDVALAVECKAVISLPKSVIRGILGLRRELSLLVSPRRSAVLARAAGHSAPSVSADNDPYKSLKTALKAEIDPEAWETLYSDTSRPFPRPSTGRIAVKVINHFGDEVLKVFGV